MQYREEATKILSEIIERFRALDHLSESHSGQKLDSFEPLSVRLERIRTDLTIENRMLPALRKTNDLRTRLLGGMPGANDPKFRSSVAAILGSYQRTSKPPKAKLGGLRGGRPRKDGRPTQTLERKGYSAEHLPPPKEKGLRVHPTFQKRLRATRGEKPQNS